MAGAARCAQCGAAMGEADQWCSLCLAPVTSSGATNRAVSDLPPPVGPAVAPPVAPPRAGPALPPPAVPAMPPPAGPAMSPPPQDPDEWLAALAAQERQNAPPLLAAGRRHRFAIMVGGAMAIIVVLSIAMVVASMVAG